MFLLYIRLLYTPETVKILIDVMVMKHSIRVISVEDINDQDAYIGCRILATKDSLIKILGIEPEYINHEKIKYMWVLILDDKWQFTIYDWKTDLLSEYRPIYWSIGSQCIKRCPDNSWVDLSESEFINIPSLIEALEERGLKVKKE